MPGAAPFDGGEGLVYDQGHVYLTTKGDDRVWDYDIEAATMRVLYDAADSAEPVLNGVDNIIVSAAHDLYVAEDGGNLEVCVITPDLAVFPVVRMTGPQHGEENATPIPTISEVTGLAFSPDGNRLYFNSERGQGTLPSAPARASSTRSPAPSAAAPSPPQPARRRPRPDAPPAPSPEPGTGSSRPPALGPPTARRRRPRRRRRRGPRARAAAPSRLTGDLRPADAEFAAAGRRGLRHEAAARAASARSAGSTTSMVPCMP